MMDRFLVFLFAVLIVILSSCSEKENKIEAYSFFVAGHTYGKAGVNNIGFHPPFKDKFDFIRNTEGMSFGVLTGDIVFEPTSKDWQEVDQDIADLGLKVHMALGNHEYRDSSMVVQRFNQTYYSFKSGNDLHLILDPNLDRWNISGDQLLFFKNEIKAATNSIDHIFRAIFIRYYGGHQIMNMPITD